MTPQHQDILRASLEKTSDAFFRRRSKLVLTDGAPTKFDATGLLVVLAGWVGDLIKGAPEDMKDQLFMSFADTVVTVAGIKAAEAQEEAEVAHDA